MVLRLYKMIKFAEQLEGMKACADDVLCQTTYVLAITEVTIALSIVLILIIIALTYKKRKE